jgi:hypothetical protein
VRDCFRAEFESGAADGETTVNMNSDQRHPPTPRAPAFCPLSPGFPGRGFLFEEGKSAKRNGRLGPTGFTKSSTMASGFLLGARRSACGCSRATAQILSSNFWQILQSARMSPADARRPTCSRAMRRGGSRRTSPSCRSCCGRFSLVARFAPARYLDSLRSE